MRWLLVDGIDSLTVGERAVGHKTWSADEEFFEDHFPRFPVVPGVLVMEALAQLAGKLVDEPSEATTQWTATAAGRARRSGGLRARRRLPARRSTQPLSTRAASTRSALATRRSR